MPFSHVILRNLSGGVNCLSWVNCTRAKHFPLIAGSFELCPAPRPSAQVWVVTCTGAAARPRGTTARRAESQLVMAKKAARGRRPARVETTSPRKNLLSGLGISAVDYKDTATLRVFISERGKIRSRRVTGLTVREQRQVATAIRNAREMALLPYPKAAL